MKYVIIALCVLTAILFGGAWLIQHSADNSDARATAGLLYLPCLALLAFDVVVLVGWLIVKYVF